MEIYYFLITFIISFFLIRIFIPLLKKCFPDKPNERGMHKIIKPTSGGILFVFIYALFATYQGFYLPLISIPLSITGLLDDKYNIPRILRFIIQVLTLISVILLFGNNFFNLFAEIIGNKYITFLILLFLGSAIVNFANFIDGIDGLLCGVMIVVFLTINGEFHYLLPFIGALTAFLIYNWQPSKLFMGDSGSLFIGSYFASLSFTAANEIIFFKNLLLFSPLFFDCIITIIWRIKNKQNIFSPHKLHLYQRLVSSGMSHSKVSLIYISAVSFLGLLYNFNNIKGLIIGSLIILLIGIVMNKKLAITFK